MDSKQFDRMTQCWSSGTPRRAILGLLAGGVLGQVGLAESTAKKKKKVTLCLNGQTINVKKSKKGSFLSQGATKGACAVSPPPPPGQTSPPPPPSAPLADAACPGPGSGTFGTATPNARFAQTFTPIRSGQLVTAQVTITKAAGSVGDYVATINTVDGNGVPTNTVLATASIPNASVAAGESTVTFTFPIPAPVTAGIVLALVVSRTGTNPLTLRGDGGNRCVGGAFDSSNQNNPFLSTGPQIDFDYATFVRV